MSDDINTKRSRGMLYGSLNWKRPVLSVEEARRAVEKHHAAHPSLYEFWKKHENEKLMNPINEESLTFSDNKRKIRGKFFMVQSHVVAPKHNDDRFGRPTFDWPGKTIFMTREEAERCARSLAKKNPDTAFFVMEASCMFEATGDVVETKL